MRTFVASAAFLLLAASPAVAEEMPVSPSPLPSAAQGVQIPDFATKAWIVVDADSGDVLAGQNIDEQRPMASTLKTLTALTLLPRLQYDSTYEGNARETLTEGMHVGVLAGTDYTVEQLMHGMLMRSGNDAAVALADAYGYQRTLSAMNAEAQRIGAVHTVAKSPNGLDQPGQVTTAADLAQIYRVAIQDPRMQELLTTRAYEFPAQSPTDPKQPATTFTIYNHDTLLTSDYPGFLGGKSGFTSQAGRTYVAGVERDGRRLVVALLGIGGGTTSTARQVLDWSFSTVDQLTPIGQLPQVPAAEQVSPEPATSNADLAPLPPDPVLLQQAQTTGEQAVAAAQQAVAAADQVVATTTAAQAATSSGLGVELAVAGLTAPPFAGTSADPAPAAATGRGFLASLVIGLFKALMWTVLLLGVAVVLLRIRAVRRQRRRRAAYQEAMRARSRAEDPRRPRSPSRTG
ncbi:MAG TPA: serine hydrolase [Actinomycetota bacterium]|nr:serine hydrolase [Actinomycetota bacterium]